MLNLPAFASFCPSFPAILRIELRDLLLVRQVALSLEPLHQPLFIHFFFFFGGTGV
jgi:hypothetical protein